MAFFKKRISIGLLFLFALLLNACGSHKEVAKEVPHKEKASAETSKKVSSKYAAILGVSKGAIDNVQLYSFIDDWYGTPYKYGGSNKKGIDCSNFTATLYREVYNRNLSGSSAAIFEQCKVVSKDKLKEGDLVFFKIEKDQISHIGVYLQNNKFVHATTKKGVMIDDLDEAYYKKYFYKGGRLQR